MCFGLQSGHEAKVMMNLKIQRSQGVRRGRFLQTLVKRGRDLTPRADIASSFLFSKKDIHMCKVPFKYIKKYLQMVRCKNLMSSGN
jgi:hypothetical protein